MPKQRGICKKCKTRKARYREGTCAPCHNLLIAENSHEQYGIDPETPTRKMWREQAAIFNALAADGKLSLQDIANRMEMTTSVLRSLMQRAKIDGAIPVVDLNAYKADGTRKPPTVKVKRSINDHGQGSWGKTKCKCDLCKKARSIARSKADAIRRPAIKKLKQELEKLLSEKKRGRPRKAST